MKKLISLLMAMVMVFSMAPAVFATEDDGSIVLFDETAVTTNDEEASWGVPFETVAPGDGNITITFDDISEVVPEYRVTVDGNDVSGWQNCLYDGLPTNTYMVAEGDSILIEICTLVNGSYAPASIHFTLVYTPASSSTEQEIITGTATFEDAASAFAGKSITYTAQSSGTLVFNLYPHDNVGIEYKFEVSGGMAGWYATYDGDPTTQSAELSRGDTVDILISTSSAFDVYVPGTVDYELIFTPSEGSGEGGGEVTDTVLELGDNNVSIASGESYSASYTFTAEEDGLLTLDVTKLIMTSPYDGATDVTDYIYDYIGGALYIYVNDNYYEEPVSVTAGDTVEIYLFQNRMYSMSGYAWDMVLNLSMGGGSEGGRIEIGTADLFIDEGEAYSNTFVFTPEKDGVLNIDFLEVSSHSPANGDEDHTDYAEELLGGTIYLYVNEVSYIGDPITVTAGVPVEIYIYQVPMYVQSGYSWFASLSLSIETEGSSKISLGEAMLFIDEGTEYGNIYTFTPEQDGLLYIDFLELSSYCEANGDEDHTDYAEELLGGTLYLYVNEESYIGNPISVTAGVPVEIYLYQVPMLVNNGYSWYASISLSLGTKEAVEPTELADGENEVILAEDESVESVTCVYTATETGTLVIDVPFYMSICGDEELYPENVLEDLTIVVNGEVVSKLPYSVDVTEGDEVTVEFIKNWWAGIGYAVLVDLSYALPEAEPTVLVDGENTVVLVDDERVESVTCVYTATKTGTLVIKMPSYKSVCDGEILDGENLFDDLTITVNGVALTKVPTYLAVNEGDVVTIVFTKNYWAGIGFDVKVELTCAENLLGDVNCDGKVNIGDANLIRRYAAKLVGDNELNLAVADVDGNDKVNIADANLVRRYAAKLIDKFPVEE